MESSLPVPSRASSAEDSNGSVGEWRPAASGALGSQDKETDPTVSEGRVRKLQRTGGPDNARRKSSAPNVTSAPRPPPADSKSSFRGRRQSVREPHKAPLGPRPYEKQR